MRIDSALQQQFEPDAPGGAVLIMKGDSIVFSKGYGLADLKTKAPVTTKTLFNLGSISKTFVANAILILQEQGKLSVEDSLQRYFPSFKNKSIAANVKIKHLLTHTSGLPDNRHVSDDTVFYLTAKDAENWAPELQVDSLLFTPGQFFDYSNPAFNGLALIVEQVSGQPWQKFIAEKIFAPSGMRQSRITNGSHPSSGVARAYVNVRGQWVEDDYGEEPTFAAAGNGGVWSSVEELALYEKAMRNHSFLSARSLNDSHTAKITLPVYGDTTNTTVSIGWSWFISERDGFKTVGHTGSQGGFLCNYVSIPEQQILFVILGNYPFQMRSVTELVMNELKRENYFAKTPR